MARLQINDLPLMQDMTPEQLKELFGAGKFTPTLEALEDRIVRDAGISVIGRTLVIDGDNYQDVAQVRQFGSAIQVDLHSAQTAKTQISTSNPRAGRGVEHETLRIAANKVSQIVFKGMAGDDYFTNKTKIASKAYGGEGNDVLRGGSGADRLYGDNGNDKLYGNAGNDYLYGGRGNDYLYGSSGNDYLSGSSGNDYLSGSSGNDRLYGSNGNDRLYGSSGNDKLDGGTGQDMLDGGSGQDTVKNAGGASSTSKIKTTQSTSKKSASSSSQTTMQAQSQATNATALSSQIAAHNYAQLRVPKLPNISAPTLIDRDNDAQEAKEAAKGVAEGAASLLQGADEFASNLLDQNQTTNAVLDLIGDGLPGLGGQGADLTVPAIGGAYYTLPSMDSYTDAIVGPINELAEKMRAARGDKMGQQSSDKGGGTWFEDSNGFTVIYADGSIQRLDKDYTVVWTADDTAGGESTEATSSTDGNADEGSGEGSGTATSGESADNAGGANNSGSGNGSASGSEGSSSSGSSSDSDNCDGSDSSSGSGSTIGSLFDWLTGGSSSGTRTEGDTSTEEESSFHYELNIGDFKISIGGDSSESKHDSVGVSQSSRQWGGTDSTPLPDEISGEAIGDLSAEQVAARIAELKGGISNPTGEEGRYLPNKDALEQAARRLTPGGLVTDPVEGDNGEPTGGPDLDKGRGLADPPKPDSGNDGGGVTQ